MAPIKLTQGETTCSQVSGRGAIPRPLTWFRTGTDGRLSLTTAAILRGLAALVTSRAGSAKACNEKPGRRLPRRCRMPQAISSKFVSSLVLRTSSEVDGLKQGDESHEGMSGDESEETLASICTCLSSAKETLTS